MRPRNIIDGAGNYDSACHETTVIHSRRLWTFYRWPEAKEDDNDHEDAGKCVHAYAEHSGDTPRAPSQLAFNVICDVMGTLVKFLP